MTIITVANSQNDLNLIELLLRYEFELSIRRLNMRCIAADDDQIHLEVATRTQNEKDTVIRLAKDIFRSGFVA